MLIEFGKDNGLIKQNLLSLMRWWNTMGVELRRNGYIPVGAMDSFQFNSQGTGTPPLLSPENPGAAIGLVGLARPTFYNKTGHSGSLRDSLGLVIGFAYPFLKEPVSYHKQINIYVSELSKDTVQNINQAILYQQTLNTGTNLVEQLKITQHIIATAQDDFPLGSFQHTELEGQILVIESVKKTHAKIDKHLRAIDKYLEGIAMNIRKQGQSLQDKLTYNRYVEHIEYLNSLYEAEVARLRFLVDFITDKSKIN